MNITKLPVSKFHVTETHDIFHTKQILADEQKTLAKIRRVAWNIFSIVVFPVGIGRLIGKVGKLVVSLIILPAAEMYNLDKKKAQYAKNHDPELLEKIKEIEQLHQGREEFLKTPSNHATQTTLQTADDVKIDTVAVCNEKQSQIPEKEQKWIIFLNGNAMCYEKNLDGLVKLAQVTDANVLSGNYRGVMRSEGLATSAHHLVLDAEAMIQHLLDQGVQPKNIMIHGWSLGGAVAAEAAAYHQEKGNEMHLCSERSFASVAEVVKTMFPGKLGWVLSKFPSTVGWEFQSVKNFQNVKGYKFTIYSKQDGVIKHDAGLFKHVEKLDKALKSIPIEARGDWPKERIGVLAHAYPLYELQDSFKMYASYAKQALQIS